MDFKTPDSYHNRVIAKIKHSLVDIGLAINRYRLTNPCPNGALNQSALSFYCTRGRHLIVLAACSSINFSVRPNHFAGNLTLGLLKLPSKIKR